MKRASWGKLIPWLMMVRNDVVMCKDGSLLVCYEINGQDIGGLTESSEDDLSSIGDAAFSEFKNMPITIWTHLKRRYLKGISTTSFSNPIAKMLETEFNTVFEKLHPRFSNRQYLSVLISPSDQSFLNRIKNAVGKDEPIAAILTEMKAIFNPGETLKQEVFHITESISKIDGMLRSFEQTLERSTGLRRLYDKELINYLGGTISANDSNQINWAMDVIAGELLDTALPNSTLQVASEHLFNSNAMDAKYITGLTVIKAVKSTPSKLNCLLGINGELDSIQIFRIIPQSKATIISKRAQQFYSLSSINIGEYFRLAMKGKNGNHDDVQRNAHKMSLVEKCKTIESKIDAGNLYGWYSSIILCNGSTLLESKRVAKEVQEKLKNSSINSISEQLHLLSGYSSSIPGQWRQVQRWLYRPISAFSDFAPFKTVNPGSAKNDYFSESMSKHCPALAELPTEYGVPYRFNFHIADLGNAMVIGPSRTGKSTIMNFLLSQFAKYHGRLIIFDKSYSCWIPTILQGGKHIDFQPGSQNHLNPLLMLDDPDAWPFLSSWIEKLICARGYSLQADDEMEINSALRHLQGSSKASWRLHALWHFLSDHLQAELAPWVGGGPLAYVFDHMDDSFEFASITCMEMGELLKDERSRKPVMSYVFYRIERDIKSTRRSVIYPTTIYVEEGHYLLSNPEFTVEFDVWLRDIAKKLGHVIITTQSLGELAKSAAFEGIIDNIPTRIFLPNKNIESHLNLYKGVFLLNDIQIEMIRSAIPKREYIVIQGDITRKILLPLPPRVLACCRSDLKAINVFKKHWNNGQPTNENWQERYIDEVSHVNITEEENEYA